MQHAARANGEVWAARGEGRLERAARTDGWRGTRVTQRVTAACHPSRHFLPAVVFVGCLSHPPEAQDGRGKQRQRQQRVQADDTVPQQHHLRAPVATDTCQALLKCRCEARSKAGMHASQAHIYEHQGGGGARGWSCSNPHAPRPHLLQRQRPRKRGGDPRQRQGGGPHAQAVAEVVPQLGVQGLGLMRASVSAHAGRAWMDGYCRERVTSGLKVATQGVLKPGGEV